MSPWYEKSFGEDYQLIYRHRSAKAAETEVRTMMDWLHITGQDHVLDLCCGSGRHSIALARNQVNVVGIDLSKTLLTQATQEAQGLHIPYVRADMRDLPLTANSFDVVLNLFTSFGYFEHDADNRQVLAEIARVLKPQGRFLIDYLNHSVIQEKLLPLTEREEQGLYIREKRFIEDGYVHKDIFVTDGHTERSYQERVRMYTHPQMVEMLSEAGLNVNRVFGSFSSEPYHLASERMILLGTCVGEGIAVNE